MAVATDRFMLEAADLCAERDRLRAALAAAVKVADEALDHWDADRDLKVGKYLAALSGHLKGYRPDTDEIHAALAAPSAGGRAGEAEG